MTLNYFSRYLLILILFQPFILLPKTFKQYLDENDGVLKINYSNELDLSNQELTDIDEIADCKVEYYGHARKITKMFGLRLNLDNNQIESLPENIGNLTNITSISLQNNHLKSLPNSIGNLVNLETLYLSYNQLNQLPNSICNLANLNSAAFNNNNLTTLPDLPSDLIWLRLSSNQITELPNSIGNLSNLTFLNLDNNELTCLPEEISDLKRLKTLKLNNNHLNILSETICKLDRLEVLDVSNNYIAQLPGNLFKTNIKIIKLENNPIAKLPQIDKFSFLKYLNLNSTLIESLDPNFMDMLLILKQIDICLTPLSKNLPLIH